MQNLMVFETSCFGHHEYYLRLLVEYWLKENRFGRLDVVISPQFYREHSEFIRLIESNDPNHMRVVSYSQSEHERLQKGNTSKTMSVASFLNSEFDHDEHSTINWTLFESYARKLSTSHAVMMYFDDSYIQVAGHLKFPCTFSGIFFRPTFHYAVDLNRSEESVQRLQEKFTLSRVLKHPNLSKLFCLDSNAVEAFGREAKDKFVCLPDPVPIPKNLEPDNERFRVDLGVDPDRKLLLFFGELSPRKGLTQLLESLTILSAESSRRLSLLIAGPINAYDPAVLDALVQTARKSNPIQIIRRHEHIPDGELSDLFFASDLILLPYQRHVGMSGILLKAAAHGKPVLTQDYGCVGQIVRDHSLGLTVDTTNPAALAQALVTFLGGGFHGYVDRGCMTQLALRHEESQFAKVFFNEITQES